MLLNFLDVNLYKSQGKAITNFDRQLPALQSDFYKDGQITGTDPNYIIPDSLNRELTYADIANLSARGLSFARNEMMARMGRGFKTGKLF